MSTSDEKSACQIAMEAALQKTLEVCGSPEEAAREAAPLLGINGMEPDEDCPAALEEGLNKETCTDFRGIRQWVMCRIFHSPDGEEALLDKHDGDFQAAIEESWDMAKSQCQRHDVNV